MANEKVISMRLVLKGDEAVLSELTAVNTELAKVGKQLQAVAEKSKAFDVLAAKLEALTKQLESVGRRIEAAQTGKGAGNVAALTAEQAKLRGEIDATTKSAAQLKKELAGTERGSQAYKDLAAAAGRAKGEQKLLSDEIRAQQVIFERTRVAAGSYRDLELQVQQLRTQFRLLGEAQRQGSQGNELLKQITAVDTQLKSLDKSMGIYVRNVGNYASAFDGFIGVTQKLAGVVGVSVGLNEFIRANAQASDEVANVAKTANASIPAIRKLQEELKFRGSRTSLVDQLKIAEIGGQLGVLEKDLLEFTKATDVVTVALKDEFGGSVAEVTKQVATLRNVIPGIKTGNVADDVLKIGNALNFLSAEGNATAPSIADFVNRLSGIAGPLDVGKASLFGLSATLDELGVSAERGATAVQKTLFRIGQTPDQFAAIAGKGAAEFKQLVQTDIVSAFGLVTKGAAESSEANTEFIKLLGELGIKGSRELETFGKLGANFDLLKQRVEQAGVALEETTSVTTEYEKKNNTFGASIDKLNNAFINLTVNTDFQDFLTAGIDGITGFVNVLAGLPKLLADNKAEFFALAAAIAVFNREAILASLNAIRQSAAFALLTDSTKRLALQQSILGAVMKALPFLAVIAVVYAAVKAYQALTTTTDAATRAAETLAQAQKEIAKEAAKEAAALNESFKVLKDSKSSLDDRAKAIKTLQETYPEYLKGLDLEKASLGELTAIQNKLNESIIRSVAERKKAAATDRIADKIIEQRISLAEQEQKLTTLRPTVRRRPGSAAALDAPVGVSEFDQTVLGIAQTKAGIESLNDELIKTNALFDETFKIGEKAPKATGDAAKSAAKVEADLRKLSIAELESLASEAAQKELDRRKNAAARAKEISDQEQKDAKTAADNIARLQQELIDKTFDGRIKLARAETATAISALVGTPQQIEAQRLLLEEQLRRTIDGIELERGRAQANALRDIEEFRRQTAESASQRAADSAGRELETVRNLNQIDETKAEGFFTLEQQRLEQQLSDGLITREEYTERTEKLEIQHQRALFEISNESAVAEKTLLVKQQQEQLAVLKAGFEAEAALIENQRVARDAALTAQFEAGAIDAPTLDAAQGENLDAANQAKLDAERAYREEQALIIQEAALGILEVETDLAAQELQLQQDTDAQKLESAERTRDQMLALQNAQLDSVSEFIGGVSRLLAQDVENRRKYGAVLKTLALAEIAINLRKELSAIAAASIAAGAATGPLGIFTAGGIYAAQAATAIIRAALNGASVLLQKFEYGGEIPTSQSVQQVQGGSIPSGSGLITGPPHSAGGVKAIYNKRLVEFEGGEYHLRNGNQTYIINKRSTQRYKDTLLRLSDAPNRYSKMRRQIASEINSKNNWGKKFALGGVAPQPLDVRPLEAPQVQTTTGNVLNAASVTDVGALLEVANAALELAVANSTRIDNIRVINDPVETLEKGTEQAEIKSTRNL
jgi:TP901 family phage tail tape measure protein